MIGELLAAAVIVAALVAVWYVNATRSTIRDLRRNLREARSVPCAHCRLLRLMLEAERQRTAKFTPLQFPSVGGGDEN